MRRVLATLTLTAAAAAAFATAAGPAAAQPNVPGYTCEFVLWTPVGTETQGQNCQPENGAVTDGPFTGPVTITGENLPVRLICYHPYGGYAQTPSQVYAYGCRAYPAND